MTGSDRSRVAGARVAAASAIAVVFMGSTLLTPLYPIYETRFGFGAVVLTLVYAAYVLGSLAALLFFGRISDQIGRRRAVVPALAVAALAALVFVWASSPLWLAIGRALSGFSVGIAAGAATARLIEIEGDAGRATLLATSANFVGLALGPVVAGPLAQYAPAPLVLPYAVYLALAAASLLAALAARDAGRATPSAIDMRPRIGVPRAVRGAFAAPAITGFCTFGFIGFYAALLPDLLGERLGIGDHAVAGLTVAGLFLVAAGVNLVITGIAERSAMLTGLALQLPALALLVVADRMASFAVMAVATVVSGASAAFGYRGSLGVVNAIAPAPRRAELVSSYMMACFTGNSVPVIGLAVLGQALGDPVAALTVFAGVMAVLAMVAIALGMRFGGPGPAGGRHGR